MVATRPASRGGVLAIAALLWLGAAACDRHVEPFVPGEEPSPPDLSRIFPPETAGPGGAQSAASGMPSLGAGAGADEAGDASSGESVRGVVELAPGVEPATDAVLFVIARRAGAAGGPPLAVLRLADPVFPQPFALGPQNVMMPGLPFEGPLVVSARLDADGSATTRGDRDLEAVVPDAVGTGSVGLRLVLGGEGSRSGAPASAAAAGGEAIRGTLSLAPEFAASAGADGVVFIVARRAGAQGGPPVAALRIPSPSFPLDYSIGPDQVMIAGVRFEGSLELRARLDGDGDAITRQAGDLQNGAPITARPGERDVAIILDERI